ncbi:MAG TPA: FAD-dependent oxidoreductase, partial [Acidobacteriota bacterium]|nr:FAD-dependent oxidoreductase [Acidobacteriota bacterium]
EQGRIHLVRESLRERALLLRLAPAFVRPVTFLLPTYRGAGRPAWMLRLGLALYGALAGGGALAAHRALDAGELLVLEPRLRAEGLTGGFEFHDAQMDDALLCVATAVAAERAGAEVRTYTDVAALERAGAGWRARLRDTERGVEEAVEARWIVNAAGPWADRVRSLARPRPPAMLRRTRGTHVVLEGAWTGHALLLTARRDGRVFFALPWGSHTLLGTTDVDDAREPESIGPEPADIRYLLEEARAALPGLRDAGKPVRAFAGVRPLARGREGAAPSSNPREHRVLVEEGIVTIVGGKYTTHRRLAAEAVDRVAALAGRRLPPSATADSALALDREREIEGLRRAHPARIDLPGGFTLREAEVVYAVRAERAVRLDDVLVRRTRLWLDGRALRAAAAPAAEWMARLRGWDEARRRAERDSLARGLDAEERAIEEGTA